jgi:DNA-binding Xre family transcriptional regulator
MIKENIKEELRKQGLTQKDLAVMLYPNAKQENAYISFNAMCNGKTISFEHIHKICSYLNISPNKLFKK